MNSADFTYLALYLVALLAVTVPLGRWVAAVLRGEPLPGLRWCTPLERSLYRLAGVDAQADMTWRSYAVALVIFNLLGGAVILALQLAQARLPLNPQNFGPVPLGVAVNTAVSFLTNTNWQAYSGEASLSYLTQMAGLGVQNFLSAATGLAVMAALARGLSRKAAAGLGNFWTDVVRSTIYVLLPLSFVLAVVLVSEGVVQSFAAYPFATTLAGQEQVIPLGPAASQVAIKQLGTNGGGFFGLNSAHPFENPTPLSNFLQMLALLALPAACVYAYGLLVGARRHAWVVYGVMTAFFVGALGLSLWSEYAAPGSAALALEGKEVRFGITPSVLWANATTAASNGSVNAMHSSLSPLAGGLALFNMLLGEIIFGGVGSGLYGMVMLIVLTVFLAGLMVGRTPEYLGKKIEAFEVRMAALAVLLPCAGVLLGCAVSFATEAGRAAVGNAGPHALTEILYAWGSMTNNNGSAFGSLTASGDLYTWGGALAMVLGRFGVIIPVLALAGGLAAKKTVPASSGTFPTDGPLFAVLLAGVMLIVAALTYFPALTLGPVLEHLLLAAGRTF
ncbi:potassium-transporting ATPase subunit KdpA [Oleiharenicola lentus]|uniref:Potassium-transporting ATPase potassium-binding subunit n=1 Tax=Oleiharenicola lentus TaxID=2508720 RepID=A0A4Q1C9A0_9BACT|nr:potassium-transporting ATPase subunit KdpA [Oleiharenicola lentus]RXK55587.1 potassium-transporting ATPase subunit KdpA [Oleiharenicola lentus]